MNKISSRQKKSGIFVIGSPIVDVFAKAQTQQVEAEGLQKGLLCLLEPERVRSIMSKFTIQERLLGGSAANTAVGVGYLGGDATFAGSFGPDEFGKFVVSSLAERGVDSACTSLENKGGTTCVHVLITEDGERTMLPIYGASRHFQLDEACQDKIRKSKVVFTDAYQFDAPATQSAVLEAYRLVRSNGGLGALTLSDPNCVTHYRERLLEAASIVDILIGNEDELKLLFAVKTREELNKILQDKCRTGEHQLVISTLNKEGSYSFARDGKVIFNKPYRVDRVIDQTGAGDCFAAGFLYAYLKGKDLETCGKVGSLVASSVVKQVGAKIPTAAKKQVEDLLAADSLQGH